MHVSQLLRAAIEGAFLAVLVALLCALVPRLKAGHRALLWWLVSAKLLIVLLPLPAVRVASVPVTTMAAVAPAAAAVASMLPEAPSASGRPPMVGNAALMTWAWLSCVAALALASIPGWLRVRRLVASGRPLSVEAVARAARAAGLAKAPRVLAVPGLGAPLVTGFVRPAVLLPEDSLCHFGSDELAMTLAHEMAHVARGDLWLGLIPAAARRVFFFHPAAWIAEREHAIAREAACDEIVLCRAGADAFAYGRLLVQVATRRRIAGAIPMSRHSMLRRRLSMIDTLLRRTPLGRAGWAVVAVVALAVVPVRLLAKESGDNRCLDIGSGRDSAYVITEGSSHSMCGDTGDMRRAEKARRGGEDIVWFRVDGQDWVIRDAAVAAEARGLFKGVGELGEQQGAIGEKQSKIGMQQSQLGVEQADIGMEQAARAMKDARIAVRSAAKNDEGDDEVEVIISERAQKKHAEEDARSQQELGERQRELGERMAELGRRQAELGERQRVLGERMAREVAEAQQALSRLLARAMRDGTAQKVD